MAIRLNGSLRRSSATLRSLASVVLSVVEFKVALFPLMAPGVLLLDLGGFHHHGLLLSPLVLTCSCTPVSSVLAKIDFVQIVVAGIHVLNLILDIVDLAHVNRLVKQMLPLYLLFVESVGVFAGSRVVAGGRL